VTRPVVQLVAALVLMLGGAWLVGWWAVGLVLVAAGLAVGFDAVMRDDRRRDAVRGSHDEIIERWRNAR
jgi:uncharacterized membrane protein